MLHVELGRAGRRRHAARAPRDGGALPCARGHAELPRRQDVEHGRARRRGRRPGRLRHSYRNDGDEPAHIRCDVRPPSSLQAFLEEVAALSQAGRITRRGLPTSFGAALAAGAARRAPSRDGHAGGPPAPPPFLQRLIIPPLAASPRAAATRAGRGSGASSPAAKSPCVRLRIARDALVVVRAREALGVADHVARADPEAVLEPAREPQGGGELAAVAHHVGVGDADVLDPDRGVVEPDRVAAAPAQRDELVDRAVAVDQEVRADAGQLAELDVGRVRGERVVRGAELRRRRVVLDDQLRVDAAAPRPRRSGAASSAASGACGRRRTGSGPSSIGGFGAAAAARAGAGARRRAPRARGGGRRAPGAGRRAARRRTRWCPGRAGSASSSRCRGRRQPARRQPGAAPVVAHRRAAAPRGSTTRRSAGGSRASGPADLARPAAAARASRARSPRARAGEVGVERAPAAGPAEREVAVEVDAARVLARARAHAVGVRGRTSQSCTPGGGAVRRSRAITAWPAGSLPWIEPTTSTRTGAAGSPARARPRSGRPRGRRAGDAAPRRRRRRGAASPRDQKCSRSSRTIAASC